MCLNVDAIRHRRSTPEEVVISQRLHDLAQLRRVRDRIDREYAKPLDVGALARGVHMSAGHLSREFRRAYGESPYSYLMTRRIERAMAHATAGMPPPVGETGHRAIRNREAPSGGPQLV